MHHVASRIADQSIDEDASYNYQTLNTFNDIDVGDKLTYTATISNGSAFPSCLFNASTRTLSGTPTNSDVGFLR